GFARDLTAANAAEEDRKRLLSELQLLLDSTDEGIFAVDTEGRCTMLNHSAAATLGFKSEELFGEQVHGLFHQRRIDGSMYPEETCPITAVMRDGNPRRITDEVFWNASGQPIAVDYSAAPIVADGLIRGVVVTFTDVTERRKLEAQLERAERLGSLGRLAATVAHEFNNVLMSISPFVEILRRDATTPRSSGACDQILKALRRGKGITEEILRFTQPAEPRLASIPASDWINAFATEAASLLGNRIEFKIVSDADVPNILGDANQLHQVFTNLVINARDAMPGGGVLEIGVRRELKAKVFPFGVVRNAEQFAHFWIRDTGTGMPPEVLRHIFEPLFTTKRNGTGLGLAVTHQVVKRHGGELFVQSKVGVGSTFHLFIPLAGFATTTVAPRATESKPKRARFQRILIVE